MPDPSTPLMQQYHAIKSRYPHALLLFRLGDFYELFYEDALLASRELQITLTSRNREKGQPIPMCGVPYHAADGYIARLLRAGFKIAICDQMEQPGPGKKLVRREVVRIISPGDFQATEFSGSRAADDLRDELQLFRPRETLLARSPQLFETSKTSLLEGTGGVESRLEDWVFQRDYAERILREQFGVAELTGFGLDDHPHALSAAGAIIHYLRENAAKGAVSSGAANSARLGDTRPPDDASLGSREPASADASPGAPCPHEALRHLDRVRFYEQHDALVLDPVSVRNLELLSP